MNKLKGKIILLVSVSALGATLYHKLLTGLAFLYHYFAAILPLPKLSFKPRLLINAMPRAIEVRRLSDFWVIKDVLVDREYDVLLPYFPKTIIDLGANIGISTLFFTTKYPNAVIHAIEPSPEIFSQLRENTVRFGNIKIYQCAIADKSGEVKLYRGKSSVGSSIAKRGNYAKVDTVPALTMDDFLEKNHISKVDLLKFDIEGAESALFRDFRGFGKVRCYVGEIHYDLNNLTFEEIRKKAHGYILEERPIRSDRSVLYLHD